MTAPRPTGVVVYLNVAAATVSYQASTHDWFVGVDSVYMDGYTDSMHEEFDGEWVRQAVVIDVSRMRTSKMVIGEPLDDALAREHIERMDYALHKDGGPSIPQPLVDALAWMMQQPWA